MCRCRSVQAGSSLNCEQIFGDLAAPNIFRPGRRVTQSWCQIQLTITTVMHTDSLPRMTTRVGNALLSA